MANFQFNTARLPFVNMLRNLSRSESRQATLQQQGSGCPRPVKGHEVVFIDAGVDEPEVLLQGVLPEIDAHLLLSGKDPMVQMTEVLQAIHRTGDSVRRVHIVSHGSPGCLHLGDTELSWKTVDRYAEQLKTWFNTKHKSKDFNSSPSLYPRLSEIPLLSLYSCKLACGDAGAELLEKLNRYTGVEIAASRRTLGQGNWLLESKHVHLNVHAPFKQSVLSGWQGQLMPTISNLDSSSYTKSL